MGRGKVALCTFSFCYRHTWQCQRLGSNIWRVSHMLALQVCDRQDSRRFHHCHCPPRVPRHLSTLRDLLTLFSGDMGTASSCPQPCLYDVIPPAIWPDFLFCREILSFPHLSINVPSLALPGQVYFYLFILCAKASSSSVSVGLFWKVIYVDRSSLPH